AAYGSFALTGAAGSPGLRRCAACRRMTDHRVGSGRERLDAVVHADDGQVGQVEEEAVLDHAGQALEIVGEAGRVGDDLAGGVVDQVAAVGADQAALGLTDAGGHGDVVVGQNVGDAVGGRLVTEGDDLDRQGEGSQRRDDLGRVGDADAAGGRLPHQLLAQQGRAAALDEGES